MGQFESTDAVAYRAGKRPFDVAKKFAFENVARNGGAVDAHHRSITSGTGFMNLSGDEFLAGSRLTEDKHCCVRRSNHCNLFAQTPHFRAAPNDLAKSPGLLFALRADWRRPQAWLLAAATILVLIPTLLYYGGGWLQYGYRYFLDSVPFVIALCGLAAVVRGGIGWGWKVLILVGIAVMGIGVYWAYNL